MTSRTLRAAGVLSILAFLLTGCAEPEESEALPSPGSAPDTSESPAATTSPEPATEDYADVPTDLKLSEGEKTAAREALVTVDEYYEYYFELSKSGGNEYAKLDQYASDEVLNEGNRSAEELRDAGQRVEGSYEIRDRNVSNIDLDPSDGTQIPFIEVTACVDITNAELVDRDGNSLVTEERPDSAIHTFIVGEYESGWRVSKKSIGDAAC